MTLDCSWCIVAIAHRRRRPNANKPIGLLQCEHSVTSFTSTVDTGCNKINIEPLVVNINIYFSEGGKYFSQPAASGNIFPPPPGKYILIFPPRGSIFILYHRSL